MHIHYAYPTLYLICFMWLLIKVTLNEKVTAYLQCQPGLVRLVSTMRYQSTNDTDYGYHIELAYLTNHMGPYHTTSYHQLLITQGVHQEIWDNVSFFSMILYQIYVKITRQLAMQFQQCRCRCMHTCTYAHTHTHTHARTHARTHSYTHAHTHTCLLFVQK